MDIPKIITCVDCGAEAHLMTLAPEEGWEIGDVAAYRCSGCMDRWDLVISDPDEVRNEADSFDFRHWLANRDESGSS